MPIPMQPVSIATPGNQGLQSRLESSYMPPQWSTVATNCVIDSAGRVAARKGWTQTTSTPLGSTPTIKVIHEYIDTSGDKIIISSTASGIYDGTATLTSRLGATTQAAGNWKFVNHNDYCLAWQAGEAPMVKSGAGDWANITFDTLSAGSHTWGNEACAAYGRVWTTNADGTVVKYSSLLDHTDFASDTGDASTTVGTTAGVIDTKAVWVNGMDSVVAIAAFNGYIVFFGKRNILIYGDATGGNNYLDPNSSTFGLVEAIDGRGCIARDSVQAVGDDILFASYDGVFSLGRTIQEKSNPQYDETANIRDQLATYLNGETPSLIKSTYNKKQGFYLLSFPTFGVTLCMDLRGRSELGGRKCTWWTGNCPGGLCSTEAGTLYLGQAGVIGTYEGYLDGESNYYIEYYSGWFPINEEQRFAILKKLTLHCYTTDSTSVTAYWAWDYSLSFYNETLVFQGQAAAEYGTAEYGIAEFGPAGSLSPKQYMGRGFGSIIKFGVRAQINGPFAIQQINLYAKPGRI